MHIPKIIHQTWKDEQIPVSMRRMAASWRRNHPDWEYRLWTDKLNRDFIAARWSDFLVRYDSYMSPIQRVDAVRYLILYTFGGLYVDLDFECLQPFGHLLSGHECLFGLEPEEHCRIHNRPQIIGNALMAAAPRHSFFLEVLKELSSCDMPEGDRNNVILETTGPFMVTRVFERCQPPNVVLLPSRYLYPLAYYEVPPLGAAFPLSKCDKLRDAYAVHHYAGSWWKGDPSDEDA